MRIISLLIVSLFMAQFAFANEAALKSKMEKLKALQLRVAEQCMNSKLAGSYRVKIEGKTYTCDELIVITNGLAKELDDSMEKFKEACAEDGKKSQHNQLAAQVAAAADKVATCTPSPDQQQCLAKFGCGMVATAVPIFSLPGVESLLKKTSLKECMDNKTDMPDCLVNIMRGIFDSIWSALELIWDVGKYATMKAGEFLGIIEKSEAETSERAMMAQQASPGFLKSLMTDPGSTIKAMAKTLYDSLEASALNHYGCEKWSGLPFASSCLKPMTTWQCGSCQQKAQVYCGIAGYAIGEIGTAFLTGGLVAGGKVAVMGAVKLGAGPAKNVASFMAKTFPKSAAEVEKVAGKVQALAKVSFTASQNALLGMWEGMKNSKITKAIGKASDVASKSIVGKATAMALKPIAVYLKAMDKAFLAGNDMVEAGLKGRAATDEAIKGAKIADAAMGADAKNAVSPGLVIGSAPEKAPAVVTAAKATSALVPKVETKVAVHSTDSATKAKAAESTEAKQAANAEDKALDAEATKMIEDTKNLPELLVKYRQDPEYAELFKAEKVYPDQHRDMAIIISDMEKRNLSKTEIRHTVEKYVNTCGL